MGMSAFFGAATRSSSIRPSASSSAPDGVWTGNDEGVTPSQPALARMPFQGEGVVPIRGTRRIARRQHEVAALDVVLSRQDLAAIERAAPRGVAAGERDAPAGMATLNR